MILAAILLGLCQLVGFAGLAWCIKLIVDRKQREIEARIDAVIRGWVVPETEGEPHKLAQLVQTLGAVVGQAAAQSIMASINADKSHVARLANSLADEAEGAQNPLLGLLAGGKRGKGAALARLMGLLGSMGGNVPGAGGNGHSDNASIRNRLQKGV